MNRLLTAFAVMVLLSFASIPPAISGRWKVHDPKGADFLINFRADQSFTAYTAVGKVLITGNYRTNQDSFLVNDANCNAAYWGSYKMTFFSTDSALIQVLSDSCVGRAQGVNGISIVRLKKP